MLVVLINQCRTTDSEFLVLVSSITILPNQLDFRTTCVDSIIASKDVLEDKRFRMKTVLIRGCNRTFGREIAQFFLNQNWRVVATMRVPDESLLPRSSRLTLLSLDVTDQKSINRVLSKSPPIDLLVNNMFFNLTDSFIHDRIRNLNDIYESKFAGSYIMSLSILPHFRNQKKGEIVNIIPSCKMGNNLTDIGIMIRIKGIYNFTHALSVLLKNDNIKVHLATEENFCLVKKSRANFHRNGEADFIHNVRNLINKTEMVV